jgi:adenylate cyclase
VLGWAYLWQRRHEQAITEAERGLSLDANSADAHWLLADILNISGRPEEAFGLLETAMRLNPHYARVYLFSLGHTYYLTRQYEEAIRTFKRVVARAPDMVVAHRFLAAIYGELGREEEACAEAAEVLRISPNFSVEVLRQRFPYRDEALLERHAEGLRKAGLK